MPGNARVMDGQQLLIDLAGHQMCVHLDSWIYRHLVFQRRGPNSRNMWFEIVTWPGSLAIHGDMGTWTFSRVEDMFTFFRRQDLEINKSYWCEKVESESRFGGPSQVFSSEVFEANIRSSLEGYDLEEAEKNEIIEDLHDEVFGDNDESTARRKLEEFMHLGSGGQFVFNDSWEIGGRDFSYHFLWCLYAIVWGIQQYDEYRAKLEQS